MIEVTNETLNGIDVEAITIPVKRYVQLLEKESVYDYLRNKTIQSQYVSELDKFMFKIIEKGDKE